MKADSNLMHHLFLWVQNWKQEDFKQAFKNSNFSSMNSKVSIFVLILVFISLNSYSQDLFRWSKSCFQLTESHKLYLGLMQSEKENEKKRNKIYKQLDKRYKDVIAEVNSLIENNNATIDDKNSFLIRNIHYLNLSNQMLESIGKEKFKSEIKYFDDVYNKAFKAQKRRVTDIILDLSKYDGDQEFIAVNLLIDLLVTDPSDIETKKDLDNLLDTFTSNKLAMLDSLESSLNNKGENLIDTEELLKNLSLLNKDSFFKKIEGKILTSQEWRDEFTLRNKSFLDFLRCKNPLSIDELKFFNQKLTENVFNIIIEKTRKILSKYEESFGIDALNLASHIHYNNGEIKEDFKNKFFKKGKKLYYLEDLVLYEVSLKDNMISFQFNKKRGAEMKSYIVNNFKMKSYSTDFPVMFPQITDPKTFHELFIDVNGNKKYRNSQDVVFLTQTFYPTKTVNGGSSSEVGNRSFNYTKVKSLLTEDLKKYIPKLKATAEVIELSTD